jgi:hypothetical protein
MKKTPEGKGKALVLKIIISIISLVILIVVGYLIIPPMYNKLTGKKTVYLPERTWESETSDGWYEVTSKKSNLTQDEIVDTLNNLIKDEIDNYEMPLDKNASTLYGGGAISRVTYDSSGYYLSDLGVTSRLADESIEYISSTDKIDNSKLKIQVEFNKDAFDELNSTLSEGESAEIEKTEDWFGVSESTLGQKLDYEKFYNAVKEKIGLDENNQVSFIEIIETSEYEDEYIGGIPNIYFNDLLEDGQEVITSDQLNTRLENLEKIKVTYTNGYEISLKDLYSYLDIDESSQKIKFTAYIAERSDEDEGQSGEISKDSEKDESGTGTVAEDNKENGKATGQTGETDGLQSGNSGTESQELVLTAEQEEKLKELNNYIDKTIEVELASYDTVGKAREFKTSTGETITVTGGTYGKIFSSDLETEYLIDFFTEEMEKAQSDEEYNPEFEERTPIYSRDLPEEIGNTYIEVSIEKQHVWVYTDGNLTMESDCVTGKLDGSHATPTGTFFISEIQNGRTLRPAGSTSGTWVNKWMRITSDGVGLHDAYWRSAFGGTIYKASGSHGCINLPKTFAYNLFDIAYLNEPIIVY